MAVALNRVLRSWDLGAPSLGAFGALVGGTAAIGLFGVEDGVTLRPWFFSDLGTIFLAPLLPALATFVACGCTHRVPWGWPLVRGGAAAVAYFGFFPAWFLTYDRLRFYPEYIGLDSVAIAMAIPLALSAGLAFVVAKHAHNRLIRVGDRWDRPSPLVLRWLVLEESAAIATALVAIPQALTFSSRAAPYLMLAFPIVALVFVAGSLALFWSAFPVDPTAGRRDFELGIALHLVPWLMSVLLALQVALLLVRGDLSFRDPYYQTVTFLPTLVLTPPLVFLWFGILVLLHRAGPRGWPPIVK